MVTSTELSRKEMPSGSPASNEHVASSLEQVAELLEAQGANRFRVAAYRQAAGTVRGLKGSVARIVEAEGLGGLTVLPGIGRSLAHAIDHLARTGKLGLLERLRGENAAERIFATVADIGPGLAHRIHEQLGIETLFELEAAAYDGRLAGVSGMGQKRLRAVRESLAGRFQSRRVGPGFNPQGSTKGAGPPSSTKDQKTGSQPVPQIPVSELLDVDEQYRRMARQGKLPRIAPRRFNPTREAWLPVLHTMRDSRNYTALYSNTARAHEMGTTHDWVVIYLDDDRDSGRWTVITSSYGKLRGRRIVRGREDECAEFYKPVMAQRNG